MVYWYSISYCAGSIFSSHASEGGRARAAGCIIKGQVGHSSSTYVYMKISYYIIILYILLYLVSSNKYSVMMMSLIHAIQSR